MVFRIEYRRIDKKRDFLSKVLGVENWKKYLKR
jgi:hypothetical protein